MTHLELHATTCICMHVTLTYDDPFNQSTSIQVSRSSSSSSLARGKPWFMLHSRRNKQWLSEMFFLTITASWIVFFVDNRLHPAHGWRDWAGGNWCGMCSVVKLHRLTKLLADLLILKMLSLNLNHETYTKNWIRDSYEVRVLGWGKMWSLGLQGVLMRLAGYRWSRGRDAGGVEAARRRWSRVVEDPLGGGGVV
jgi:hypothetical protein